MTIYFSLAARSAAALIFANVPETSNAARVAQAAVHSMFCEGCGTNNKAKQAAANEQRKRKKGQLNYMYRFERNKLNTLLYGGVRACVCA